MLQNTAAPLDAEPASPSRPEKYEFRDLKRDLESMQEQYSEQYPRELVYEKLFDVAFQMTELLSFVNRQVSQNSELFAKASLKQLQSDYNELKTEFADERNNARDSRHE